MKYYLVIACLFLSGCLPQVIEKQSEPLSQAVYGINDSLKEARIDLAWYYSNQTTELVTPPKKRLDIKPIYQKNEVIKDGKKVQLQDGTRVAILPEQYSNDKVVIVNTEAYKKLVADEAINNQLKKELIQQKEQTKIVEEQRKKNDQVQSELLKRYDQAKLIIEKKDKAIWIRNFAILGLLVIIGGYIGLRIAISYGKMSLPFII